MAQGKRLLLDMAPLASFFIAYRLFGLMVATAVIIGVTFLSLGITYWREKTLSPAPLISGIVIAVFGALTLALHDEDFIKIKPTIINCLFAALLLGGVYGFKRGLLRYVLNVAFHITEEAWLTLSARWGYFFLFLAALNEVIWRNFSTDFWVNFKVFGMLSCTLVFTLSQMPFIHRHRIES